jgi:hypothetical protein
MGRFINWFMTIMIVFILVALVYGGVGNAGARAACKAMGYKGGSVNFNPRKHYRCSKGIDTYWVEEDGTLVKDDDI